MSFRNIRTAQQFKEWCQRDGRKLRDERRINTSRGIALLADGAIAGKPATVYAVGRDDVSLKVARVIEWKPDVPTTLTQRLDHAESEARKFLAEWRPYNLIAHEFRKHA